PRGSAHRSDPTATDRPCLLTCIPQAHRVGPADGHKPTIGGNRVHWALKPGNPALLSCPPPRPQQRCRQPWNPSTGVLAKTPGAVQPGIAHAMTLSGLAEDRQYSSPGELLGTAQAVLDVVSEPHAAEKAHQRFALMGASAEAPRRDRS
ncbi:MAG: hypothetical protein ACRDYY_16545, partial [Acidimicrobiales bacterium]